MVAVKERMRRNNPLLPILSFTATIDRVEALLWFHENY